MPWQCAWEFLRPLIAPPPGAEGGAPEEDAQEETQHEALLVRCSLNACAARRVVRGHSLQDVLSLQPRMRLAHLSWIPERAVAGFKGDTSPVRRGRFLLPPPGLPKACLRASGQAFFLSSYRGRLGSLLRCLYATALARQKR